MSTNVPCLGAMYSDINSLKCLFPTKQMPMLSFFRAIAPSPASVANLFASLFSRSPTGNMVRRNAFCGIWDRKNVWSFHESRARNNFASKNSTLKKWDAWNCLRNLTHSYFPRSSPRMYRTMIGHNVRLRLHQPIAFRAHNGRTHWILCAYCNLCLDSVFGHSRIPWERRYNQKSFNLVANFRSMKTSKIRTQIHRSSIA